MVNTLDKTQRYDIIFYIDYLCVFLYNIDNDKMWSKFIMGYTDSLEEINIIIYVLNLICISIGTYYLLLNNTDRKDKVIVKIKTVINIIIIAIFCEIIKYTSNFTSCIFCLILLLSINFSRKLKNRIGYYILITTICLSINYILFFLAVIISYFPNAIINIKNNYISFTIIAIIYFILCYTISKIKRFKNGFGFLKRKLDNEYLEILILDMSAIILFLVIMLSNYTEGISENIVIAFVIFAIIMFITIQKSIKQYYKQKMLIQELKETKEELENKKEEIKELEQENLNFSKTSHTIAHRQKSIEHKLNELIQKSETAEEIEIASKIQEISKEIGKL